MEAGAVPHHHRVLAFGDRLGEQFQELVDELRVDLGAQETFGVARFGAHRPEHPQVLVLGLPDLHRSRALLGSDAGVGPLLAEPRLVLKVDPQPLAGVLRGNVLHTLGPRSLELIDRLGVAIVVMRPRAKITVAHDPRPSRRDQDASALPAEGGP